MFVVLRNILWSKKMHLHSPLCFCETVLQCCPTCSLRAACIPRGKYLQLSVTWVVSVIQFLQTLRNRSTEHNMATLIKSDKTNVTFVNNAILVNSVPRLLINVHSSPVLRRVVTSCVAVHWVEIGQACCIIWLPHSRIFDVVHPPQTKI